VSDVLVSSMPEDEPRVAPLVAGLRAANFSVWCEAELAGGEHRPSSLAAELAATQCVVVVWTAAAVGTTGALVQDIAARARERGVLLPVRLDRVDPPLGFGQVRTLDLAGWNGKPRHKRFKALVAAVRARFAGAPLPPPARTRLRWLAGVVSLPVLLALLSFVSDLQAVSKPACRLPGIRTVCARWGLGGVPTPAEEAAWTARPPGDCAALRAHIARFPAGAYAEEAERRLQAVQKETRERWSPETHSLPLTVLSTAAPWAGEVAARADAVSRSVKDAEQACAGYRNPPFRLRRATAATITTWNCTPRPGGVVCGFTGEALCEVEVRTREVREICP
jgi:hypothetical protein